METQGPIIGITGIHRVQGVENTGERNGKENGRRNGNWNSGRVVLKTLHDPECVVF